MVDCGINVIPGLLVVKNDQGYMYQDGFCPSLFATDPVTSSRTKRELRGTHDCNHMPVPFCVNLPVSAFIWLLVP